MILGSLGFGDMFAEMEKGKLEEIVRDEIQWRGEIRKKE